LETFLDNSRRNFQQRAKLLKQSSRRALANARRALRPPRHGETLRAMCNLYSITKGQQAIRDLAGAMRDLTGNLPMLPGVFPDYSAPIVRTAVDGVRELTMARWGMPSPIFALKGRKSDPGVTNIRNVGSPHWRRWLGAESRCVVPFTSFAEHEVLPDGSRPPVWFALDESRPLAFFAGIWTRWTSVRKVKEGSLRFPDDGAQRRRGANPPQGNAGHFDEGRRNRGLACGADCGGLEAATAAARRRASDRRAGIERGWGANALD
jgi:SOS response associated peptidase (SRAP)